MADGFWVRTHGVDTHASTGAAVETDFIANAGSTIQENRRLTLLGCYFSLFSEASVLYAARLIIIPEMITDSDLSSSAPEDDDDMIWSKFYAHKGVPAYFQLKSKRTLGPDDKCIVQTFALSVADDIAWSMQSYVVGHG